MKSIVLALGLLGRDMPFSHFILPEDRPDEAGQFAGYCRGRLARHLAAIDQVPVSFPEPHSCAVGDVNGPLRLALPALLEIPADSVWMPVIPRRLDEQSSDAFVAGFGDAPFSFRLPAGVLRRRQAQVTHELPRRGEATHVEQFSDQRDRRERVDAMEAPQ